MRTSDPRKTSFVLLAALALGGCGSSQPKASLVDAVNSYRGGNYKEAYEQSVPMVGAVGGRQSDEATYMAGMSAYRLGKDEDALRYLGKLTEHNDGTISGPAAATVGLIMAKRGQHDRAVHYYQMSLPRLKGNDLAQAYFNLALSEQKVGRWAQARPHLVLAATNATDPALRAAAEDRVRTAGFTLQFGAYKVEKSAQQRAREVAPFSDRAGLGQPRVVPLDSRGRRLYHVQVGNFSTHEAALNGKNRLNRTDVSVEKLVTK